jgi:hypothetical protein
MEFVIDHYSLAGIHADDSQAADQTSASNHQKSIDAIQARRSRLHGRYEYMFKVIDLDKELPDQLIPVFEELCANIDNILGDEKLGFHWDSLHYEPVAVCWYWRLNGHMDPCVGMFATKVCTTFALSETKSESQAFIGMALTELVARAMEVTVNV